jgi:hypothetical protein
LAKNKRRKPEKNYQVFLNDLVTILKYSASITIPHCGYNPYTKPYWNSEVKNTQNEEQHKRKYWVADGRPRDIYFESYRDYKRAKSMFRNVQYTAYEQNVYRKCKMTMMPRNVIFDYFGN